MPNPLRKKNAFISPFLIHKTSKLISLNVLCNSETINNYHELFWLAVKRFIRECDSSWYREPEVAHLLLTLLTAKKVTGTLSCAYNALQKHSFAILKGHSQLWDRADLDTSFEKRLPQREINGRPRII